MKKTMEFILRVTVDEEKVVVEMEQLDNDLPVMPVYDTPTSMSVELSGDDDYITTTSWHGSEEMWYTYYKE